jgi:hypothetical protein
MKPLILTGCMLPDFTKSGFADLALDLAFFRFVWGPQPSSDELAHFLGPYTSGRDEGRHWSIWGGPWKQNKNRKHRDLSLAEFCQHYETVELWFDMRPDAQLKLIWLLDYFRSHPKATARLKLRLVDLEMIELRRNLAGVPGIHAGSVLRSASRGFESLAAAQAGLAQLARGVAFSLDRSRHQRNADA